MIKMKKIQLLPIQNPKNLWSNLHKISKVPLSFTLTKSIFIKISITRDIPQYLQNIIMKVDQKIKSSNHQDKKTRALHCRKE